MNNLGVSTVISKCSKTTVYGLRYSVGPVAFDPKNHHANLETIRKMVMKFLVNRKINRPSLAKSLKITLRSLDKLIVAKQVPRALVYKVHLPLIKLYCATKW